jgi:hypothetical protein
MNAHTPKQDIELFMNTHKNKPENIQENVFSKRNRLRPKQTVHIHECQTNKPQNIDENVFSKRNRLHAD